MQTDNTCSAKTLEEKREGWRKKSRAYSERNREKLREASAKYKKANPVAVKAAYKKWAAENKEYLREKRKKRYAESAEKVKAAVAKWRSDNPERVKESIAQWSKNNPEKRRVHKQTRRARKLLAGGILSSGLIEKLYKLQKGKCPCCGSRLGNDYHLDHKMPLALGGKNEDRNMQLLTAKCNREKYVKHPIDFMQARGFLL